MFSEVDREIEYVRSVVGTRFPVYDTRVTPQAVAFAVQVDPLTMEQRFDELRTELVPKNYIPFLTMEGGEHLILVQRRPPQRFFGTRVNAILLVITLATTLWAGAINWAGYDNIDWLTVEAFAYGALFFTLPLMAILGFHEMGHYVMAKRYKVHASLPFFIPAPFTILGTFGAMISMRDPIPSRKALIDIGAAGPVIGLITAIPVTLLGLFLMSVDPRPVPLNAGGALTIELPLLYQILALFVPVPQDVLLHPTAFAGWVGLFVTALNLLPAGQLDGGHVARAVLGNNGRFLSYAAIIFMLFLGLFYAGWLIIAVFILMLGARHPPPLNDLTRLDGRRQGLAAAAAAVMLLSFVAIPVDIVPAVGAVQFELIGDPGVPVTEANATVVTGSSVLFTFRVANGGNVEMAVNLTLDRLDLANGNLNATFANVTVSDRPVNVTADSVRFTFNTSEAANVTLLLDATNTTATPGTVWTFRVNAVVSGDGFRTFEKSLTFRLRVA